MLKNDVLADLKSTSGWNEKKKNLTDTCIHASNVDAGISAVALLCSDSRHSLSSSEYTDQR